MSTDLFGDVGDFHHKFGQPYAAYTKRCEFPPQEVINYRLKFIDEEVTELKESLEARDMAGVLDALVDLVYVALGTAHYLQAPFPEAWREVHAANMRKVRASGLDPDHKRGPCEPMRKPEGWVAPDIENIINAHNGGVLETRFATACQDNPDSVDFLRGKK
jgi:predicted HAD superfamily Cof-like phosphohydrolase